MDMLQKLKFCIQEVEKIQLVRDLKLGVNMVHKWDHTSKRQAKLEAEIAVSIKEVT